MKTLLIYAHPNPKSFNQAILQAAETALRRRGFDLRVHDLYAQGFNPLLGPEDFRAIAQKRVLEDVKREQEAVAWAEFLVFIHPIWWFERPAILKGWFDRVFSNGFAYSAGEKGIEGLLKGKCAYVFTTSGRDFESDRALGMTEAFQTTCLVGTLEASGIDPIGYANFFGVSEATSEARARMLSDVESDLGDFLDNLRGSQKALSPETLSPP